MSTVVSLEGMARCLLMSVSESIRGGAGLLSGYCGSYGRQQSTSAIQHFTVAKKNFEIDGKFNKDYLQ